MSTELGVLMPLLLATFLCSLVSGFLFAFSIVVMPGIRRLNDNNFIQAFQVIDGVIQDNQWLFIIVWVGSNVALITTAAIFGFDELLIVFALLAYILGVQVPTFMINIPLNNQIQSLNVNDMDEKALKLAREDFESRWNQSNSFRTVMASLVSAMLMIQLYLL